VVVGAAAGQRSDAWYGLRRGGLSKSCQLHGAARPRSSRTVERVNRAIDCVLTHLDEPLRLQWLYGSWLPRSGFVPDDQPCFEAWDGRPFAQGAERFALDVQLPVKRA
jgi:hypothetical protein